MTWDDPFFYPHKVTVRDRVQGGGTRTSYGAARRLSAEVKDEQRLVRDASGAEVVSSSQVTVPLSASVAVGALVTVWPDGDGKREAQVLAVARNENDDELDSYLVLSLA